MVYGYAWVSVNGNTRNGNSLEAQEKLLREHGATKIYYDTFTGAKVSRPQFDELLKVLKRNDTLVTSKLDRIARSLTEGSAIVNECIQRGIRVDICDIGRIDNTPATKLIRGIFFALTEFERYVTTERLQEGKELSRRRGGCSMGRPKAYTPEQMRFALELLETNSYSEVVRMTKISKSTLQRIKKEANRQRGDSQI